MSSNKMTKVELVELLNSSITELESSRVMIHELNAKVQCLAKENARLKTIVGNLPKVVKVQPKKEKTVCGICLKKLADCKGHELCENCHAPDGKHLPNWHLAQVCPACGGHGTHRAFYKSFTVEGKEMKRYGVHCLK